MMKLGMAVRLLAATALIGGVVFAGGAMAASGEAAGAATKISVAEKVAPATPAPEAVSSCGRKVKVVYAGYGEAARAACGETTKTSAAN